MEKIFFPEFKKIIKKEKADLYIGHTLTAIPVVSWAAEFSNSKFAFDAEDYHREESEGETLNLYAKKLKDKYLINASYVSAASPFIAEHYQSHYPNIKKILVPRPWIKVKFD